MPAKQAKKPWWIGTQADATALTAKVAIGLGILLIISVAFGNHPFQLILGGGAIGLGEGMLRGLKQSPTEPPASSGESR